MASLIPKSGVIFNHADTAPPPSKDYCQIIVTWDQVMFRLWKIAIRNDVRLPPSEMKDDYEDFLWDDRLHSEIHRCFGKHTLEYVKGLAEGHIDYLPRLPRHLLIHILRFLPLEDLSKVATLSKMFRELCNSDALWEILYRDHMGSENMGDELRSLAEAVGWRKLFFTNKLQLQVQLRRATRKHRDGSPGGEDPDVTASDDVTPSDDVTSSDNVTARNDATSRDDVTARNDVTSGDDVTDAVITEVADANATDAAS